MIKSQYRFYLNRFLPELFILIEHIWNAYILIRAVYGTSCLTWKVLALSQRYDITGVRLGSMSPTSGVMVWRAISCPGGLGRTSEVEVLHCMLYVKGKLDCTDLDVRDCIAESLWVKVKGINSKADVVIGVCYWPPTQQREWAILLWEKSMDQLSLSFFRDYLPIYTIYKLGTFNCCEKQVLKHVEEKSFLPQTQ